MPAPRLLLRLSLLLPALLLALLIASPTESAGGGVTYIVDTNSSSNFNACNSNTLGDCSLFGALSKAQGADNITIHFQLPNCPAIPAACIISPTGVLPHITHNGTTVDGTTQPGYQDTPVVVVDGSSAGNVDGITVDAADNVFIWGLVIRNYENLGISNNVTKPTMNLSYNDISQNGAGGVSVAVGGLSSELDLTGNSITNNGFFGVFASSSTIATANIMNNTITGNSGRGLDIAVSGTLTLTGNTISNNTNNSEGVYSAATTSNSVIFTNNQISNNGARGVVSYASTSLNFSGNTINNNGGAGLDFGGTTVDDATIANNTISGNQGKGVYGFASNSFSLTGNTISSSTDDGAYTSGSTVDTATITGNTVSNNGANGLVLAVSNGLTLSNNVIQNNTFNGVDSTATTTNTVTATDNNVLGNQAGGFNIAGASVDVHFNRFLGNGNNALSHSFGSTIDGTNNWWGCNEGPGQPDCDASVGATVAPWLVLGLDVSPPSLQTGNSATLTSDVNHDSNATDTSGAGHLPDGIQLLFATDIGNIDGTPQDQAPLSSGQATDVFNAPNNPSTAHVSVTLDNETVINNVTVLSNATPTPSGSPTPTPSTTPEPTPTPTEGAHLQGDTNCDGNVNGADALRPLVHASGISPASVQGAMCPDIGDGSPPFGDVNCDGDVDELDVVAILQFAAGLDVDPPEPDGCTPIGAVLT